MKIMMRVMRMAIEIMGEILSSEVENIIYIVNTEGVIVQTVTSLKDIFYVPDPVLIGKTIPSANEIIYYPNPIET
jgi:hypothetical protein